MRSGRTPFRGMFSHTLGIVGQQAYATSTIAPLAGNTMPAQGSTNTIVIPRDGWYRITLDMLYQNAAGTQGYCQVVLNGAQFMQFVTTEPSAALAPTQGMSRNAWLKAGDRIVMQAAHNEASAVVRNLMGNLYIDEVVQP